MKNLEDIKGLNLSRSRMITFVIRKLLFFESMRNNLKTVHFRNKKNRIVHKISMELINSHLFPESVNKILTLKVQNCRI